METYLDDERPQGCNKVHAPGNLVLRLLGIILPDVHTGLDEHRLGYGGHEVIEAELDDMAKAAARLDTPGQQRSWRVRWSSIPELALRRPSLNDAALGEPSCHFFRGCVVVRSVVVSDVPASPGTKPEPSSGLGRALSSGLASSKPEP